MNVRELYKLIQNRYPEKKRDLNHLAWPLHQPSLDVQYIDKQGHKLNQVLNPIAVLFPEPLGGPFYDLEAIGLAPILPLGRLWKQLRIVVKDETEKVHKDGLSLSCNFYLRTNATELKGLASDLGINWYHVDFDYPWKFTIFPKLDDCIKYERTINKSSL